MSVWERHQTHTPHSFLITFFNCNDLTLCPLFSKNNLHLSNNMAVKKKKKKSMNPYIAMCGENDTINPK